MLKRLSLRAKLLWTFLFVGLVPLGVVGWMALTNARESLSAQAFSQLEAVRSVKKAQVEEYFKAREADMHVLVETVGTVRQDAFNALAAIAEYKTQVLEKWLADRKADVHAVALTATYVNAALALTGRLNTTDEGRVKETTAAQARSVYRLVQAWKGDEEALKEAIAAITVGTTGYVWVVDYRGNYVVSKNREKDGTCIWESKDSNGVPFIQEAIAKAKKLSDDQVDYQVYPWLDSGRDKPRQKLAALAHVPSKQWVIGVGSYFDELVDSGRYAAELRHDFETNARLHGYFSEVKLLDLQGNHLVSLKDIDTNESQKPWFKAAVEAAQTTEEGAACHDLYVGPIEYSDELGLPGVHLSHVIRDRQSFEPVAVFVTVCDVAKIQQIMANRVGLGQTGQSYLVGSDFVVRSDLPLAEEPTIFKRKIETEGVRRIFAARQTRRGKDICENYVYKGPQGQPVLGHNHFLQDLDVAIICEIDVAEAFCPQIDGSEQDFFGQYKDLYGYYDLFLINPDGYVFYSVTHEADYQTNMLSGPHKESGLGKLTRRVLDQQKFGFADFEPYAPKNNEPASFIALPIIHHGEVECIVALQIPLAAINNIMGQRDGMGETGGTYLVGPDHRMRCDGAVDHMPSTVQDSFKKNLSAESASITAGLAGESGRGLVTFDVAGESAEVLSAYAPLNLWDTRWVILAEIDGAEAFAPIHSLTRYVGIVSALAFVAIITIALFMTHAVTDSIVGPLRRVVASLTSASDQVDSASSQISESSQQLASGANQQAAALEETSASMEQMASQTKNNADSAQEATAAVSLISELASQNAESAKAAHGLSAEAKQAATNGAESMTEISDAMSEIRAGSDKISDIIQVIEDITHQTKMLATNAAIEAARAGDQGKGFAVVADEVSKLAESSKNSAKKISDLIRDSARKARAGSELADKGTVVLREILDKTVQVAGLIDEIAEGSTEQAEKVGGANDLIKGISVASSEQANGVDQITRAVTEMDKVTQQNAASAQEAASSAEELSAQAAVLKGLVNEIAGLIGQKGGVQAATTNATELRNPDAVPSGLEHRANGHTSKAIAVGNGRAFTAPTNRISRAVKDIPMPEDFLDF